MDALREVIRDLVELGPQGLARFEASLEPEWIESALVCTGSASIRRRKLPAEQAVWLVLGMGLFWDRSIRDIVDQLDLVLPGTTSLAPSAITQARQRLGPEPIAHLFRRVAAAWSSPLDSPGYRDLALFAVDGVCIRVPDSKENFEHFGKPPGRGGDNDAGYPQLRMTCLLNLSSRMLRDARFGPYRQSEDELAKHLWDQLPPSSLVILDRGYSSYSVFRALVARGDERHFMVRMREDMKVELLEALADGSARARLIPSRATLKAHPELHESTIEGRVVAYQHPGGKPSRLFVSLIDHEKYPAKELVQLYHERWEIELAYDELKTHMVERNESLRSKTPRGIEQELWGLLTVYNLVRREMMLAAEMHRVPPRRISFRSSLMWIRSFLLVTVRTAPANIPKHLGNLRSTLDVLVLPERRSERRFPRHVKIKMSRFARNRGRTGPEAHRAN